MIDCVKLNGHVLQYADDELKDKELVLTAVIQVGLPLQFE